MTFRNKALTLVITAALLGIPIQVEASTVRRPSTISDPRKRVSKKMQMAVSAYSPKKKRNGSITATGTKPIPGCTVAVSQDNKHLLGKKIFIHGIGERLVTDLMDVRWKNKVDVCVSSKKEARLFGVKARVSVFVL